MKKLLMFLFSLLLVSCVSDVQYTEQEMLEKTYNAAFEETFGKISPTQTWGFNQTSMRSAYPNGNMWESEGYVVPSPITEDELNKVLEVFNQKGKESYEALIDIDCFFVQQVYKGTKHYTAGNGADVYGADHMDWLVTYDPVGTKETKYLWSQERGSYTEIVINHDDHVNDFNNSYSNDYDGCMLMVNSSTQRFGFRSSEDGDMHYTFRMEEIDGNYYVGLDFVATGANPNQQVERDLIYNDWIVKIVPGKGYSDKVKEEGMIICEDLGTIGDFDFNDVVFYAKVWESGKTEITLLAAGGQLDISVAEVNVGDVMGKMVNTGLKDVLTYYFESTNKYNSLIDIPIVVSKKDNAGNVTSYALSAEMGKAPQKICVPKGFKWCKEYKSLVKVYPGFKDWTTGASSTWTGNYDTTLVYNN
jgi:hypothetical protein